jgi:dihydrofolate reductase
MRRLIYYITVTLDGKFSAPDGSLDAFVPSEAEHQYANDLLRGADALIFGRRMYEVMSYWDSVDPADASQPPVERDFAAIYQSKPRYVLSTTLTAVDPKAAVISSGLALAISQLKSESGGYLALGCGPQLLAEFLDEGLLDEIRLLVLPKLLGDGISLFGDVRVTTKLDLRSVERFETGSLLLTYEVR